jgi:ribose/xylose/arabinose/galactoside ABC-type transport system permease subunit
VERKRMISKDLPFIRKYAIYIFLVLLFVISSLSSPTFLKHQNLKNILNQAAPLGIASIGQTFVILTGRVGLDLSVASVMATVAVIFAGLTGGQDVLFLPVVAICLLFGSLVGLSNGLLITKRRVPPFMATLGMTIIVQGLRFIYTRGAPKGNFPPILRFLGTGEIGPIPVSILSLAILTAIAAIILKKTTLGRQIYVIGGNINTAILSGYNVNFIVTLAFMISGFMAAIAGIYLAGWIGISDNWVGKGYELDSIAAVVIGGTSLHGGRGGVLGTIAGVLIIMMLYNLVLILHLPFQVQLIVKGVVIILAASFWSFKF